MPAYPLPSNGEDLIKDVLIGSKLKLKKKVYDEEDSILDVPIRSRSKSKSKKKVYDEEDSIIDAPIGWRFVPTEEELVVSYLASKVALRPLPAQIIKEIDAVEFYSHHPKNFVDDSCLRSSESKPEQECYLFIHYDEYFHGSTKRTKPVGKDIGCWKSNGKEESICGVDGNVFACKIHYTFYSKERKTHWKMEEYRLVNFRNFTINDQELPSDEWVVSKIRRA